MAPEVAVKMNDNMTVVLPLTTAAAIETALKQCEEYLIETWPEHAGDKEDNRAGAKNIIKAYLEQF